ncbi:MAG: NUDIX domain-containing protein [Clostridia bacterium]
MTAITLTAAGVVRDGGGRVLLVRRDGPGEDGRWVLPGGRVERDEVVQHVVAREIYKTSGFEAAVGSLLFSARTHGPDGPRLTLHFACTLASGAAGHEDRGATALCVDAQTIHGMRLEAVTASCLRASRPRDHLGWPPERAAAAGDKLSSRGPVFPPSARPAGITLAVAGVVPDGEGRVLLVRRGHPPEEDRWALPGGRVEPEETLEHAVVRELREECGLTVSVGGLLFSTQILSPAGGFLVLDFACTPTGGELKAGDDSREARFLAEHEMPGVRLAAGMNSCLRDSLVRSQLTWAPVGRPENGEANS